MGIGTAVAYFLRLVADIFDKSNSVGMVNAKKAADAEALKNKVEKDVATGNVNAVRDELAS